MRELPSLTLRAWCLAAAAAASLAGTGCRKSRPASGSGNGAVPGHGVRMENAADQMGLQFRWEKQPRPMRSVEAFGSGCAFLDYDDDGFQDVLLVSSDRIALYRNGEGKRFEDVTEATGLKVEKGYWTGCAAGDYDGDGWLDLLLTGYQRLALLHNEGGKRWIDVTTRAGLDPHNRKHWGSSAGFMDLDANGTLDLVLLNYVIFGPQTKQYCEFVEGIRSGCPPSTYDPEYAELWQNAGPGRFREVTGPSGLRNTHGKALVVAFTDLDEDGTIDEPYSLLRNAGDLLMEHQGDETGLTGATFKPLGFGTKWLDVDNDGWADLMFANGHVYDNTDVIDPLTTLRQPLMLFHNRAGKELHDLAPELPALAAPILGRGLATGDFDNDGRIDALAVDFEGAPVLLHNQSQTKNHWLKLDLRGTGGNRFSYGARIRLTTGGQHWSGQVSPASSYLSSSDPRAHFGLGTVSTIDEITVLWPSGRKSTLRGVDVDQILRIEEGKSG
jgi:hypothetical protein